MDQWALVGSGSVSLPADLCGAGFPTLFCPGPILEPLGYGNCQLSRWVGPGACILPVPEPIARELGRWERASAPLQVAPEAKAAFRQFLPYFTQEARAVGDETLNREIATLQQLIAAPE